MKWPGCAHAHIHPLDMAWTGFLSIHPSLFGHSRHLWRKKEEPKQAAGAITYLTRDHGKGNEEGAHETRENNCSSMLSRRWVGLLWEGLRVMRCLRFLRNLKV
jgi:hypothetical protein